ncbi:MAG: hypothetical protein WBN97_09070 [Parvibaculum sp.]
MGQKGWLTKSLKSLTFIHPITLRVLHRSQGRALGNTGPRNVQHLAPRLERICGILGIQRLIFGIFIPARPFKTRGREPRAAQNMTKAAASPRRRMILGSKDWKIRRLGAA